MTIQSLSLSNKGVLEPGFHHGFASAAYQIEGGFDQGGRGPSVWEAALKGQENGDVACDSYNRSEEDVELLRSYGANSYRFSVSWSRIIPLGGRGDPVNREGVEWYSAFIDKLVVAGITPYITLFHWDLPQALQDRYAGFLATGEAEQGLYADFAHFARICFEAFGDRVKRWITLNEPLIFSMLSATVLLKNEYDMETDRWIMARNLVMCHAHAVNVYRSEFAHQQGAIGITLNIEWMEPFDDTPAAQAAAERALDLQAGVFADPIYLGRLNPMGQSLDKSGLLHFSPDEWTLIRGSSDFFGLNHYSTRLATGGILEQPDPFQVFFGGVEYVTQRDGQDIGQRGHDGHPYTVPWGFYKLLHYINQHWVQPSGRGIAIIVTENGYAEQDEADLPMSAIVDDRNRQAYFDGYISQLIAAKGEGVAITGYFGWSLMDNLEWSAGYRPRFGVTHVDRDNDLKRLPKESAYLIKRIFQHLMRVE